VPSLPSILERLCRRSLIGKIALVSAVHLIKYYFAGGGDMGATDIDLEISRYSTAISE